MSGMCTAALLASRATPGLLGWIPQWIQSGLGHAETALNVLIFGGLILLFGILLTLEVIDWRTNKRRQRRLHRLSLAATRTELGVVLLDAQGQVQWANAAFARLSGCAKAGLTGRSLALVLQDGDTPPEQLEAFEAALIERRPAEAEMHVRLADGTNRWLHLRLTPIKARLRAEPAFLALVWDITGQKQRLAETEEAAAATARLLQATRTGVIGLNARGEIEFVNPAASELTGWQPHELHGRPINELVQQLRPQESPGHQSEHFLASVFRGSTVFLGETDRFRRRDGTSFPVELVSDSILEGGQVIGSVVFFRDITEQLALEQSRERALDEATLRAALGEAFHPDPHCGLRTSVEVALRLLQQHFQARLACAWLASPEGAELELAGCSDWVEELPTELQRLTPGAAGLGELLAGADLQLWPEIPEQLGSLLRDWAQAAGFKALGLAPLQADGQLLGWLGLWTDRPWREIDPVRVDLAAARLAEGIARKRRAAEMAERAGLLDKSQDAIIVIDLAHRVRYWNKSAERLYGWPAEQALGRPLDRLIYRDRAYFERACEEVLAQGEWAGEGCQTTSGDETVTVESRWTLLRDEDGQPKSILIVNTDITEKKRIEEHLLRSQRMESIGTLAGGIAHDLNNVLSPILMSVQILRSRIEDEDCKRMLSILETSAQRGAEMVQQVLTFARGVEGERMLLQVRHLVREVVKILTETLPKSIRIKTDLAEDLGVILGDPTQLHQVLINLAVNARDAMPQGGTLTLAASNLTINEGDPLPVPEARPGSFVVIRVTDTGTGIPPEVLDKIFEPFFTTKEMGKGTGLGLATALGIVKSHGGFVEVQSKPGKGTTFLIYLPMSDESVVEAHTREHSPAPLGHGEMILAVDDEASVLAMTRQTLETHGYRVVTAQDGAEAVAAYTARRHEIRAVLADMLMPIMDGAATIRALRKLNPKVKILATSGMMDRERAKDMVGANDVPFLLKPYTTEKLLQRLHELLHEQN